MPDTDREVCPDCGADIAGHVECPGCRVDLVYCESDTDCPGRYPGTRTTCHLCGTPNPHVGKYAKPAAPPPAAPAPPAAGPAADTVRPAEPVAPPGNPDSLPPNFLSVMLAQATTLGKSAPVGGHHAAPAAPLPAAPAALAVPVAPPVAAAAYIPPPTAWAA